MRQQTKLDLNCDVGEVNSAIDDQMLPLVSSCNVCCGAHAGTPELIENTIRAAARLGVSIGAHPSWPDRENFGRQSMKLSLSELRESLLDQIRFVCRVAKEHGAVLRHVKPHGALYHDVSDDPELAALFIEIVRSIDPNLMIYAMSESPFASRCADAGIRVVDEVFADRRYESRAKLRARKHADALIGDPESLSEHLSLLVAGEVVDVYRQAHRLSVQSVCLHGDSSQAVANARLTRKVLEEHHVQIEAP